VIRRLATILLITLLAFNWYGYRLLTEYLQTAASAQLQSRLDNNEYDASKLVELRVPLNMPYITDWDDFETYEGETQINGIHYKYVKRKVENGELVLLCIPNQQKTQLQTAQHDFFKLVNDLQQPTGKKHSTDHSIKIPLSDVIADNNSNITLYVTGISTPRTLYQKYISSAFIATPTQPPEC
jgi:hypothetical protein